MFTWKIFLIDVFPIINQHNMKKKKNLLFMHSITIVLVHYARLNYIIHIHDYHCPSRNEGGKTFLGMRLYPHHEPN